MDLFSELMTLLLMALVTKCYAAEDDWKYEGSYGKHNWPSLFTPACNGTKQSPIDINTSKVKKHSYADIVFHNYDGPLKSTNITNNGHTVQVNLISLEPKVYISGGEFPDNYNFEQLHFHWGANDKAGSEHTINNVKYPLELHLVHFGAKYKILEKAVTEPQGLAVLGILFEISDKDNTNLNSLLEYVKKVHNKDDFVLANNVISLKSFLPTDLKLFYRYDGSLTTPKCYESVIWTVFDEKVKISKTQLSKFRELANGEGKTIQDNYRDVLPLNGRIVYSSTSSGSVHRCLKKFMVVILINLIFTKL